MIYEGRFSGLPVNGGFGGQFNWAKTQTPVRPVSRKLLMPVPGIHAYEFGRVSYLFYPDNQSYLPNKLIISGEHRILSDDEVERIALAVGTTATAVIRPLFNDREHIHKYPLHVSEAEGQEIQKNFATPLSLAEKSKQFGANIVNKLFTGSK